MTGKYPWEIPSSDPLIKLQGISKIYKNAAGEFTALKNINLNFYNGEFVGVIGKSGSGKSTMVNMITGIDRPTKGEVFVGSVDIHAMSESKQARWRGLNLGVVFQFFQLLPMLTLIENVLLPMDFCNKYPEGERFDRAKNLLSMVGLKDDLYKLPGAVSGGQQQSAAIARALANDPPILIADEPTGNLDAKTADSVYDKFESLTDEGRTVIMVTHDPEIEHRLSRKVLLSDGEVIDPLLASVFSWFPHPVLRQLTHEIHSESYGGSTFLDLSAEFANELILVESGNVQIEHHEGSHKDKRAILDPGEYFSGYELVSDTDLKHYSATVVSDQATLQYLPFESVRNLLNESPGHLDKLKDCLIDNLLGHGKSSSEKEGLIQ